MEKRPDSMLVDFALVDCAPTDCVSVEAAVIIRDVVQRFGKQTVLDGVSLTVPRGVILGLTGPSGSGKTTLVNLIVGITSPARGEVTVLGESSPFTHVRPAIGFMSQSDALYNDLTADENLAFFGAMYGLSRIEAKRAGAEALALARLGDEGGKLVADFSGGMRRRLSLAVALIHKPRLLILDEPTVGLDPEHRIRLWNTFCDLARAGTTILVTTHVMSEAERCDSVVLLRDGKVIAQGSPESLVVRAGADDLEGAFLAFAGSDYDE